MSETINNVVCPNCGNFKITSIPYRVHPKKGRVTALEGCVSGPLSMLAIGLGSLILSIFFCWGISEPDAMSYSGFWMFVLLSFGSVITYAFIIWRHRNLPVEYENECQICGYKWIVD